MTTADELLAGPWLDPLDESDPTLRVDGVEHADQVGRAIRALEAQRDRHVHMVMEQREQLDRWLDRTTGPIMARIEFLRGVLERYHLAEKERLGARVPKTIHLPSGDLKLRAVPLSIDVADQRAAVDALISMDETGCVNWPPAPDPKPVLVEVKKVTERKQRADGSWGVAVRRYMGPDTVPDAAADATEGVDYVLEPDPKGVTWWWFVPGLEASPPHDKVTFTPNTAPEAQGDDYNL